MDFALDSCSRREEENPSSVPSSGSQLSFGDLDFSCPRVV
jgi:hypothetical protein